MNEIGSLPARDTAVERQALAWMDDPLAALGMSNTRIHSVPRDEAEALQLAGLNLRLEERRDQIAMLAKLAEAQAVERFATLDDAWSLSVRSVHTGGRKSSSVGPSAIGVSGTSAHAPAKPIA